MEQSKKRGIVLMNLGSPGSTEVKDVRSYLMEFLMDGRVIDYPYLLRKLLVGGIIVPFRARRSAAAYQSIWTEEGSPLIVISKQFQKALQQQVDEPVELAMRYGEPSVKSAFDNLLKKIPGLDEVIAVPLYPHYAMSSYETAVEHAKAIYTKGKYRFELQFIRPFYNNSDYLHALSLSIRPYLEQEYDQILFSYHGIPQRHVTKCDITGSHCLKSANCCNTPSVAHAQCYRHQCLETTKQVAAILGIPENKLATSFQSRLGREEWLKPYTAKRLTELPAEGVKKLIMVCPAFVSDCLETLEEIAKEGRHSYLASGGESLTLIPCLNRNDLWVKAVKKWVTETGTEMLLPQTGSNV